MIPTATEKLTKAQMRRAKADAYYKLNVDLSKDLREGLKDVPIESLEATMNSYLALMQPPEEAGDTIEIQREVVQQMALLASRTMTHVLVERYRKK